MKLGNILILNNNGNDDKWNNRNNIRNSITDNDL